MPAMSPNGRYLAYAAQTIMSFQIHLVDLTNGTRARSPRVGARAARRSRLTVRKWRSSASIVNPRASRQRVRPAARVVQDQKLWSYYPDYSPDGRYCVLGQPAASPGRRLGLASHGRAESGEVLAPDQGKGNDRIRIGGLGRARCASRADRFAQVQARRGSAVRPRSVFGCSRAERPDRQRTNKGIAISI